MRRLLSVLAVLLLAPSCAWAAFTAPEQDSLAHLHAALQHAVNSVNGDGGIIASSFTNGTNHAIVGQATTNGSWVVHHLNNALSGLLGVITESPDTPQYGELAAKPRAEKVARAFKALDSALGYLAIAQAQWQSARSLNPAPGYQGAITRIVVTLDWARIEVSRVNRNLAYADFYPNPPTPGGFRTIVGPHGDYDGVMWRLWRANLYFNAATYYLAEALTHGMPGGNYANAGQPLGSFRFSILNALHAQMVFAAALKTTTPRFFFVLEALGQLTSDRDFGTPVNMHFLTFAWRDVYWPKFGQDAAWTWYVMEAMVVTADAWKHSDGAAWETMIFPDCSLLQNPTGCGGL